MWLRSHRCFFCLYSIHTFCFLTKSLVCTTFCFSCLFFFLLFFRENWVYLLIGCIGGQCLVDFFLVFSPSVNSFTLFFCFLFICVFVLFCFFRLVLMKLSLKGITFHLYVYASCSTRSLFFIRLVCKYYGLFHLSRHACTISNYNFLLLFLLFWGIVYSSLIVFSFVFSGIIFFQVPVISLCKIVYITFYTVSFVFMVLNIYDSLVCKFERKELLTKLRNFLQKRKRH